MKHLCRELAEIHIRKFESDIWKKLLWAKYIKKVIFL